MALLEDPGLGRGLGAEALSYLGSVNRTFM